MNDRPLGIDRIFLKLDISHRFGKEQSVSRVTRNANTHRLVEGRQQRCCVVPRTIAQPRVHHAHMDTSVPNFAETVTADCQPASGNRLARSDLRTRRERLSVVDAGGQCSGRHRSIPTRALYL